MTDDPLVLERVPIGELREWSDNPRTITPAALERLAVSVAEFGLFAPLVVWQSTDHALFVIGGNQRLRALRALVDSGDDTYRTVPVVRFEGTETEARAVLLRDNNNDGDWNWDRVSSLFAELATAEIDPTLSGFDADTVADLTRLAMDADCVDEYLAELEADERADAALPQPPKPEPTVSAKPTPGDYVERRFARLVVGNVRGKVNMETYGRWLEVWEHHTKRTGSTDVSAVFGSMLAALERAGRPWRNGAD